MSIIKVKTGGITADAITDALIADDVVGTEHLTANEVDTTALGADAVTGAQLADDAVNSEHYTDGSVDTAHIADAQITTAKLSTAVFTGATDIGADLADADLILVDDGAGGTIRKAALSRVKTYAGGANTPAFFAFANANQVIANATYTKVEIDTEVIDTDSKYDVSNYRFTPTEAGYYVMGGHLRFDSNSTSNDTRIRLDKNGSVYYQIVKRMENVFSISINQIMYLDSDDYAELLCYHSRGSNMTINGASSFDSTCATFYGYKLIGVS